MSALARNKFYWDSMWPAFDTVFTELDKYWVQESNLASQTNTFELEIPGVKRDSVNVSLERRCVIVEYTDRHGRKCKEERFVGTATGAEAKLEDGLLTVTLIRPEVKEKTSVKVEVK